MVDETVKGYRFAGDIEVKNILFVGSNGEFRDIGKIVLEVNVFQSLDEHYLQGEIVINDAVALLSTLKGDRREGIQGGFNGGEVIVLTYKMRDSKLPFKTHFFGVHEVSERQRVDEKDEVYILNCISAEAYRASTKTISRAYGGNKGNLISNMVKSVVDEFIYDKPIKDLHRNYRQILNILTEKEVNISPTNGKQRFVIPNMTPDDTLDFFAKEADCDNHVPYYFFYEDSNGFNFKDLNVLTQQDVKEKYTYMAQNVVGQEGESKDNETTIRDYQKIISFNVVSQTDIIGNTLRGLFRSKMINLDILRKNKSEYNFDYSKEYESFNKLQKWKIPGEVDGNPVLHMMQTRQGHDGDTLFQAENPLPKKINQHLPRRQAYYAHIFNTIVEVVVPGNSELNVGDVIELSIPNATTINKLDGEKDKYLSGKYLITSLRHKFGGTTGTEFTTFLECVKDTGIEI
jgi:hypothetical protein